MKENAKIIVAYVPVLHEGYRQFFEKHSDAEMLYILGSGVTRQFAPLAKDLRALPPELVCNSVRSWKVFKTVEVIDMAGLKSLATGKAALVMPDEDTMRELLKQHLPDVRVEFDSIFLRWDKHKSTEGKPVEADQTVSSEAKDQQMIATLKKEAEKSADWWRHIAAAVVKDGKAILVRHNHAVPSEQMPYIEGDPRSDFHKGMNVELSTALHCEAGLIADAARQGISLEGAEMYVTTFPCPPCAKLIAYSGIKKMYYVDGYGVLDGERVLKSRGVEIVFVKTS